jgi:hypothetical protein
MGLFALERPHGRSLVLGAPLETVSEFGFVLRKLTNLRNMHPTRGLKQLPKAAVAASANVGRPYIASRTVMPRKYAGFTRTCRSQLGLRFKAAARFVPLGKASSHALEGVKNLYPFMFPADAKFC